MIYIYNLYNILELWLIIYIFVQPLVSGAVPRPWAMPDSLNLFQHMLVTVPVGLRQDTSKTDRQMEYHLSTPPNEVKYVVNHPNCGSILSYYQVYPWDHDALEQLQAGRRSCRPFLRWGSGANFARRIATVPKSPRCHGNPPGYNRRWRLVKVRVDHIGGQVFFVSKDPNSRHDKDKW